MPAPFSSDMVINCRRFVFLFHRGCLSPSGKDWWWASSSGHSGHCRPGKTCRGKDMEYRNLNLRYAQSSQSLMHAMRVQMGFPFRCKVTFFRPTGHKDALTGYFLIGLKDNFKRHAGPSPRSLSLMPKVAGWPLKHPKVVLTHLNPHFLNTLSNKFNCFSNNEKTSLSNAGIVKSH